MILEFQAEIHVIRLSGKTGPLNWEGLRVTKEADAKEINHREVFRNPAHCARQG